MAINSVDKSLTLESQNRATIPNYDKLSDSKKKELKKLEATCKDFESIFAFQMMKEMRKTVPKNGLNHGGWAEDIFRDMLDQERAKSVSLGVGNMLFKELSRAIVPSGRRS